MACTCPFCPLISAKFQVHDLKIILPWNVNKKFNALEAVLNDDIPNCLKLEIVNIILWCKNTIELPICSSNNIDRPDMKCTIYRDRLNLFTFCFSTKNQNLVEN